MKKEKLLALCVLASLAFGACKRDAVEKLPADLSKSEQGYRHNVHQKMYDISEERTMAAIQTLRGAANTRLISDDSVRVDSSIWVLEAALNYDQDGVDDNNYDFETFTQTFDVPANESDLMVCSNELEQTYQILGDNIRSHTDPEHKIQVVDVEAYFTSANVITYSAQFAVSYIYLANPCADVP